MSAPRDVPALLPAQSPGPVLVALSGGLDSSVLLHALAALPDYRARGLRALHIHHGLHAQADAWQAHCAALCASLGVACEVRRVEVARDSGLGLEGAARAARRAAFAEVLRAGEWLALAHHRDDQAETFLLRALRGSGPEGLAAMQAQRPFAAGQLWRPLLAVPREVLRAYAQRHALCWIEDPANTDLHHDRNFLRHQVLPLLRQRWPQAEAALAASAALSGQASALLGVREEAWLAEHAPDNTLALDALRREPPAQRARLLRRWVAQQAAPALPARGIAALENEVLHAGDGARFAWHGVEIRRWRAHLHLLPPPAPWPAAWSASWDGRAPLALPDGGELALHGAAGFAQPLTVRARRGGERLRLPGRTHSSALKHLLQEAAMPPWRRFALPLLWEGDTLQAAGDTLLSAPFAAWLQARGAQLAWRPPAA
ncbi:tRNA lysidine(34) synthetase TilS [Stenotrophomonas sp. HITSZ_GD]|uniref:tRNA lysidine(34) synthetase TilS n=1 Tax=Stenotrophomonas sp. HITSZ_GD TaxID=3037248 RepID=UPI00240D006B|nr:tRNA lysidine(34) synthetase TilS [Stenotrophomonas sp. HITSZ_GD]MDG2524472.1 tRNA lysidine(34) synthetase TilS [Stenotrophomonas sp. HITSZ_GD]